MSNGEVVVSSAVSVRAQIWSLATLTGTAIRACQEDTHNLAKGAGAVPLAALLRERDRIIGRRGGVILCGGAAT